MIPDTVEPATDPDGTKSTVDGRGSYTFPFDGACLAQTVGHLSTVPERVEVVNVWVSDELAPGGRMCEVARDILRRTVAGFP